jgi:signal transduction histidine kinase
MKEKALQVLLVEDNAGDARLLREMFSTEKAGSFELTHLLRMSEAVIHLAKGGVDIVLLDMGLPDGHGIDTVRRTHAAAPGIPVIVLTGLDDEALAAEAMKEGAQDYLIKGQIENRALPRALRHAIERHRMQTETDLIRRNQMQFKDEFLSHVSHELRSPLTAIYQFVTILQDRLAGELNLEQHEYLEIILRNVKQLQSMINDLLEVTRVQAGKLTIELQCTSVSDAITYTVNTLQGAATAKGITLTSDVDCRLPSVSGDPTRIRQILIILVDNAVKFTSTGGDVKVQAGVFEKDPGFLLVEVSDTGCGITPEMTERVFEHLYQISDPGQAGRKGLGLGLYISKELVTRQGGKIWVSSKPQKGSRFFRAHFFSGELDWPDVDAREEARRGHRVTCGGDGFAGRLAFAGCAKGNVACGARASATMFASRHRRTAAEHGLGERARSFLRRCLHARVWRGGHQHAHPKTVRELRTASTGGSHPSCFSQFSRPGTERKKPIDGNLCGTGGCSASRSHQHHTIAKERLEMNQKTILIVDDDPDVRLGLHVRLKANHYDVIFAADGMASIAQARKHLPDLIILDLGLPAGDGFSVLERLKANDSLSLIPVIVVSARDLNTNMDRALKAGAKAFLQKPVDNAELLKVIRRALGEPSQAEKPEVHDLGSLS